MLSLTPSVQSPKAFARAGLAYLHRIHPLEDAAGMLPSQLTFGWAPGHVKRYGAVCDGVADDTAAIQAALDAGFSPVLPEGAICGVSATLETTTGKQIITGQGSGARIIKHANVPLFHVLHVGGGAFGVTFEGAYDAFAVLSRPVGAPAVVDTTDNIRVGTLGAGTPYFWTFDQCESNFAGRDGVHHFDGPGGNIGVLSCGYNARWGWYSEQSAAFDGGGAVDTAHIYGRYLHCFANGRGPHAQTEGGNICIQGHANVISCKSFGAYGEGIRVHGALNVVRYFSELNAQFNTDITSHAAGQAVTAGTYRRSGSGVYVATTTGTTGATPLTHTAGTASDGTVTWRFRGNRATLTVGGARNKNALFAIFANDNREINAGDSWEGTGFDGQSTTISRELLEAGSVRFGRQSMFGRAGHTGGYDFIEIGGRANTANVWDWMHNTGGAGCIDLNFGANGSTDYPLRLRGSAHGHIAEMSLGGRVVLLGDTDKTLFGVDVSEADTYVFAAAQAREFNVHLGGDNILPGRRLRIVSTTAQAIHIYATAPHATTIGAFGSGNVIHDLTAAGDWLDLTYLGNNLWWARMKKGGVLS